MNIKHYIKSHFSEAKIRQLHIFFAVVLSSSAMMIFNIFSAKALSVDDFGRFNLFIVWLTIGSVIARFGSDQLIVYKFYLDGTRNLMFFLFLSFLLSIILSFFICSFVLIDVDVLLALIGIFSLAAVELFFSTYKSLSKAVVYYYTRMIILAGGLIMLLIVFFSKGSYLDINFFFYVYVFLFLLINLALFAMLRFKQTRLNIPKELNIQYRSYSIFNALAGVLINRLDLILVGFFLTPGDAGTYGVVLIFLFVLNTVIGVQATYWGPIFSRFHNSSDFIMLKKSYFVSKTYSWITILIAAFFCYLLIKPSIIFLGSGYEDIASLILIRCGFQALALMLGIPGVFLSMTGNPQDQFGRLVFGVIVTGVLGLILVPYYGLIGAAIAGGAGSISSAIIGELYARKLLHNQGIKI